MHVFVLAQLPDAGETFTFSPGSFCAATPGEPLRDLTRVFEYDRVSGVRQEVVYAIGSVSHKASVRLLVVGVDADESRWTEAVLHGWETHLPVFRAGETAQTRTNVHDMLTLAAKWPVGTEVHFTVPTDASGAAVPGIDITFTEPSDVTRIIAGDLSAVCTRMLGQLLGKVPPTRPIQP